MSRARHHIDGKHKAHGGKAHHGRHHRAMGGSLDKDERAKKGLKPAQSAPSEVYAGKGSHVEHEAEEHTIGAIHGAGSKKRMDRKRGGRVKHHADGGKTGADTHPYSSAHKHGGHVSAGHHPGQAKHKGMTGHHGHHAHGGAAHHAGRGR